MHRARAAFARPLCRKTDSPQPAIWFEFNVLELRIIFLILPTLSQSGGAPSPDAPAPVSPAAPLGIALPKMKALCIGISDFRVADLDDPGGQFAISGQSMIERGPIRAFTTSDDVVDGSESKRLMVQVSVEHFRRAAQVRLCSNECTRQRRQPSSAMLSPRRIHGCAPLLLHLP